MAARTEKVKSACPLESMDFFDGGHDGKSTVDFLEDGRLTIDNQSPADFSCFSVSSEPQKRASIMGSKEYK